MVAEDNITGPVNPGNIDEFMIPELAEPDPELTGSRSKIDYRPLAQDDFARCKPDIPCVKQIIDCDPVTPLFSGPVKTIEYFNSEMSS